MMNVSTLTVTLLVCVILECAHSASFERGWERFSPRSKRSAVNRVSVVESWTSVCEEVCRVGYGGLGCALVECTAQNGLGYSGKFQAICPSLCDNNLGSTKCNCTLSRPNPDVKSARNSLCTETCGWRTSLSGCSKCKKAVTSTTVDDITDDYGSTNTTDEEIPTTDEYSTDEEDTTTDEEDSTTESNELDTTTEEATTTTSTTTTTQATTTTTRTTTQATKTTTPNWESLCETLCRNGEGGSLCNCDIPPFF